MIKHPNLYCEEHTVKFLEVDGSGTMTVKSLFNSLQEAAYNSSRSLGSSIDIMKGVTWVYSRLYAEIARYPDFSETVRVCTWRSRFEGSAAFREFVMEDLSGNVMLKSTVELALISLDTRKPSLIPETMMGQFAPELGSSAAERVERIPELQNPQDKMEFRIRTSDLDINGHVNNAAYIEFIAECVPAFPVSCARPRVLAANFLAEIFHGEIILSQSEEVEPAGVKGDREFIHRLIRPADGRSVTRGRTVWKCF